MVDENQQSVPPAPPPVDDESAAAMTGGAVGGFKPNIYPIMYWGLAFGAIAGVLLTVMWLLSRYITLVWIPVFLVGLAWGGFRNYRKQKRDWEQSHGIMPAAQSAMQEFRAAVSDVMSASQGLMAEETPAEEQPEEEIVEEENPQPPVPPV